MKKLSTLLPIVISVFALGFSVFTYARADAIAQAALEKREKEFVDQMKPKAMEIYHDFDMKLTPEEKNPQTLDELINPMIRLMQSIM